MYKTEALCPICETRQEFVSDDDFWSCRSGLTTTGCPYNKCVVRERALATALFSIYDKNRVKELSIHEAAPTARGLSLWLKNHVTTYVRSGYWPDKPLGGYVNGIRNEDLEHQTFSNECFDVVIHLDVMEHLFDPFQALRETYRTLKPGGTLLFTAPTEHGRLRTEQVAWLSANGEVKVAGKPEYHGNPQRPDEGALVTFRYGYDFPLLISRNTAFDVEVRRWQKGRSAVIGYMTEVYILSKP